jgi:hypothetical protein
MQSSTHYLTGLGSLLHAGYSLGALLTLFLAYTSLPFYSLVLLHVQPLVFSFMKKTWAKAALYKGLLVPLVPGKVLQGLV